MISLNTIQTTTLNTTTKHHFFHKIKIRHSRLFLCKNSKESDANTDNTPDGDARKQELLARIAMLQTQKVRLTDFLDERSTYLTKFAEDANAEFDQVGENALKELEEASARIMGNIESQMQAFEESAESSKLALIGLISVSLIESLISQSFDWRKGAVLGVILVGLVTQLTFHTRKTDHNKQACLHFVFRCR